MKNNIDRRHVRSDAGLLRNHRVNRASGLLQRLPTIRTTIDFTHAECIHAFFIEFAPHPENRHVNPTLSRVYSQTRIQLHNQDIAYLSSVTFDTVQIDHNFLPRQSINRSRQSTFCIAYEHQCKQRPHGTYAVGMAIHLQAVFAR